MSAAMKNYVAVILKKIWLLGHAGENQATAEPEENEDEEPANIKEEPTNEN